MSYVWQWGVLFSYQSVFLRAAGTTLVLTFLVVIIGVLLGFGLIFLHQSLGKCGRSIVHAFIELIRSIPVLILLIWIYYALPLLIDIRFSAFSSALLALSINLSAFVAETIRAGILSIPSHQRESGLALGLSEQCVLRSIVIPQAMKNILPNLVNLSITQLKNTALASVIGVNELLHQGNLLISNTSRPLEIYTTITMMYAVLILPLALLGKQLERRLHPI